MTTDCFIDELYGIRGHTVAVIHSCEDSDEFCNIPLNDDILRWMDAAQQNRCHPLVVSSADFIQGAIRNSLPQIDFAINLSDAESSSLVTALCDFLCIPCAPGAAPHMLEEHKNIIGYVAETVGLELYESVCKGDTFRMHSAKDYTLATSVLQNPMTNELHILPTVLISPNGKRKVVRLDETAEAHYIELAKRLDVSGYCQFRAKMRHGETEEPMLSEAIPAKRILFAGMDLLPDENFCISFKAIDENHSLLNLYRQYESFGREISPVGFALFCCMQASSGRMLRMLSQRF